MTSPNPNELLMGGGKSAPGLKVGTKHTQPGEFKGGRIVTDAETFPVMKRDRQGNQTNEQDTFPSGDPIWGVVVTVQTDERDPSIENDNGQRRVYIDGAMGKDERLFDSRRRAVRTACELAGSPDGMFRGGELWLAWTHTVDTGGNIPAVNWTARYVTPANVALGAAGRPATAATAPTHQAPPAPVTAPPTQTVTPTPATSTIPAASATQQFTPEQLAAMQAAGIDISQFAA
jgi:hypothetical protein